MSTTGTFIQYPSLIDTLPPLVRKQRRLEAKIAPVEPLIDVEKALRKEIDALLKGAGLGKGELVTCRGYDVTRCERKGNSSLNPEKIIARLVAGGVDQGFALKVLIDSTETADPSSWATVKPSKGSQVRAPQARPATVRLIGRDVAADRKRA